VPTKIPPKLTLLLAGTPQLLATSGQRFVLQRRDAAILAYLAIAGPTARARLLDLLWPDVQADAARSALRQRLFQMKRRVGFDLVVGDELLTLASDIATEPIATQGPSAPLLQGCDFDECPMFERWLADQWAVAGQVGRCNGISVAAGKTKGPFPRQLPARRCTNMLRTIDARTQEVATLLKTAPAFAVAAVSSP